MKYIVGRESLLIVPGSVKHNQWVTFQDGSRKVLSKTFDTTNEIPDELGDIMLRMAGNITLKKQTKIIEGINITRYYTEGGEHV